MQARTLENVTEFHQYLAFRFPSWFSFSISTLAFFSCRGPHQVRSPVSEFQSRLGSWQPRFGLLHSQCSASDWSSSGSGVGSRSSWRKSRQSVVEDRESLYRPTRLDGEFIAEIGMHWNPAIFSQIQVEFQEVQHIYWAFYYFNFFSIFSIFFSLSQFTVYQLNQINYKLLYNHYCNVLNNSGGWQDCSMAVNVTEFGISRL